MIIKVCSTLENLFCRHFFQLEFKSREDTNDLIVNRPMQCFKMYCSIKITTKWNFDNIDLSFVTILLFILYILFESLRI